MTTGGDNNMCCLFLGGDEQRIKINEVCRKPAISVTEGSLVDSWSALLVKGLLLFLSTNEARDQRKEHQMKA